MGDLRESMPHSSPWVTVLVKRLPIATILWAARIYVGDQSCSDLTLLTRFVVSIKVISSFKSV